MIDRKRLRVFAQEVSKQIEYDLLAGAATVYALTHQNHRMILGCFEAPPRVRLLSLRLMICLMRWILFDPLPLLQ